MKTFLNHAAWLFALLFSCSSDNRYGPMHGPGGSWPVMNHYGYGWGFVWLMTVIVSAIALYYYVQLQRARSARETHLEILKKRYAKGEITKEEFDRMKRDLSE
jgi:putative membrane protein